jgi:hypothetical protein
MREWPDAMVKSQENDGPAVNAGEAADPGRRRDFELMRVGDRAGDHLAHRADAFGLLTAR